MIWREPLSPCWIRAGHVDFSAEMERTLPVLDYAVLVISGTDGVQAHTHTLWRLLARHQIPVVVFVNKMDLASTERAGLLAELKKQLGEGCVDFNGNAARQAFEESLAVCDETLLERYLDGQAVRDKDIAALIRTRTVFPCYFGSALHLQGVEDLLDRLTAIRTCRRMARLLERGCSKSRRMSRETG